MTTPRPASEDRAAHPSSFQAPDLTGWLGAHDIMRTQFSMLARAAGEVTANETERVAALENHLGFMTRRLEWHHHHEDDDVWPTLRSADPSLTDLLEDMEQDHGRLEHLLAVTADRGVALHNRAPALRDLRRELAAHLDREEAEVVPAIRRIIPASAWALGDERFQAELGADRAITLTWIIGHLPPPARAEFLATLPPAVRGLYRTVWRPDHIRQVRLMYGADAARSL